MQRLKLMDTHNVCVCFECRTCLYVCGFWIRHTKNKKENKTQLKCFCFGAATVIAIENFVCEIRLDVYNRLIRQKQASEWFGQKAIHITCFLRFVEFAN